MDWIGVLITVAVAVAAFVIWLVGTALLIWGERRVVAKMQTRVGPNRLGPFGLLQTVADGAKLFFKEDILPSGVDKVVYIAAPIVSAVVAIVTFAVIPFGGSFEVGGRQVDLQVWDPEIGLLWFLAMSSIGVYGIALGGWASGSKYPLLGGIRSAAQLVSYELGMGLSMAAVFIFTGTLRASEVVAAQAGTYLGFIPAWHLWPMSPAAIIFFVAVVAESQRPPFDLPEAEGELVGGFNTEYSGAKFAMFFLAEFMAVITMSAMTVTMFFGGPNPVIPSPFTDNTFPDALWGLAAFVTKVLVFVFVFIWLRGTLPRLRYDRLMDLGWRVMLPISLAWVLATGFSVVLQQEGEPQQVLLRFVLPAIAVALILYLIAPVFARSDADADGGGGGGGGGDGIPDTPAPAGGRALTPAGETEVAGPDGPRGDSDRTPEPVGATRADATSES